MEVFEAVRTILATLSFSPKSAPKESVRKILKAARLTGSSVNLQPWHFVVIDSRDDLEEIRRIVNFGPYVAEAGMAVAVAIDKDEEAAVSDASRAIQSMILTAWSEEITLVHAS